MKVRMIFCFALMSSVAQAADDAIRESVLPALPGAEGFGSRTPGGRGGQVLLVTNLMTELRLSKRRHAPWYCRAIELLIQSANGGPDAPGGGVTLQCSMQIKTQGLARSNRRRTDENTTS